MGLSRRALLALAAPAVSAVLVTGAAAASPGGQTTAAPLSRSVHVAYGGCPARDVILTVTVPRRAFAPGQLVTYQVGLHNLSGRGCGPVDGASPSGPVTALLGPCSEIPVDIVNARGLVVDPGPQAIACPALLGPRIPAHGRVSTTGTWDQRQGAGRPALRATPVPRGMYHLVVDDKVSLPIVLP
jgi:hypothetical protein